MAEEENSQVKSELLDTRIISKKLDPEGRKAVASSLTQVRTETRAVRGGISEAEGKLEKTIEKKRDLRELEAQKNVELYQGQEGRLVRLKRIIGIGDRKSAELQKELKDINSQSESLWNERYRTEERLKQLQQKEIEIPNAKEMLASYYEKISTLPLTNKEKREFLKPEILSSLSTEEYIALWRRLNPYFLAHVTRQGFRDHTGGDIMVDHTSGYREFINGFTNVMGNGRSIFSPLARIGLVNRDEATVKSFMSPFLSEATADQAKEMLVDFLNRHLASAPKYPDITATHLAAQMVSDDYYGGERGNEVFFVYPSDILASQYAFAFNGEKDFTRRPQNEIKWNDVFVWTDPNHPGIPVDSGIVFLADKTPVDPETGSKYASETRVVDGQEKRVMIEDPALVDSFVEWGKKLDDQSLLKQAFIVYKDERNYFRRQDLKEDCFAAFVRELQGLGFTTDASATLASELIGEMFWKDSFDDEGLREIMESSGAHLKRAEKTVPAKQYWESFFAKNPGLRPKHIQYYDGDPTTAVLEFQQQNNIGRADTSKTDGQLLGFDDNHVLNMEKDPRANVGYKELEEISLRIIAEHYKGTKTQPSKFSAPT